MVRINRTKAIIKTTRSFCLYIVEGHAVKGRDPTTFQPVYPTVFT